MSSKMVTEYEIIDHGTQHADYFQGCGVSFTKFDECYTGIGANFGAALEDAIEQAVTSEVVFSSEHTTELQVLIDNTPKVETEETHTDCGDADCYASETYYHVSIRVKLTNKAEGNDNE